jgi:hypothetical protein
MEINRGSVVRIEDGRGVLLRVSEGSVWLTQEGDPLDRYLPAGAAFRLDRDGLALAQATSRTTITLTAAPRAVRRAPLASRLRRLWIGLFAPNSRPTTAAL